MARHSENPFSLIKRNSVYYVRFKNPDTNSRTRYLSAKTTGEKEYPKAMAKAWQMYSNNEHRKQSALNAIKADELTSDDITRLVKLAQDRGIVKSCVITSELPQIKLCDYLLDFWDLEKSEFLNEKKRMNKHIGLSHCELCHRRIEKYWKPYFNDMLLGEITKKDLKGFILKLQDFKISNSTRLGIYRAGSTALKWAYNNEMIDKDITAGIVAYSAKSESERKILTMELAGALFSIEWEDEKAKLANMVAMLTGMRLGEILALRIQDLGENCIYVNHSWNEKEGLKTPKNGERRTVYVFPVIIQKLLELGYMNPFDKSLGAFIFWGTVPNKPIDHKVFLAKLHLELQHIGLSEQEAKEYTFHGWRHFYTAYMMNNVNNRALQSQTGHKTLAMLQHYANHQIQSDIEQIQNAQIAIFGDIMKTSKEITFDKAKIYNDVKNCYGVVDKTQYFEHTHQNKICQS